MSCQGYLRGFDQTVNLILDECHERVFSQSAPVEQVALGLYIIRGDNVSDARKQPFITRRTQRSALSSSIHMRSTHFSPLLHSLLLFPLLRRCIVHRRRATSP